MVNELGELNELTSILVAFSQPFWILASHYEVLCTLPFLVGICRISFFLVARDEVVSAIVSKLVGRKKKFAMVTTSFLRKANFT